MDNEQIVILKIYETYSEAVVCCNLLNASGIAAFLSNESTSLLGSMFDAVNGVRLHVHASDVELAQQILDGATTPETNLSTSES